MRSFMVVDTPRDGSDITAVCSFAIGRFLIIIQLEKDLDVERDDDHISVGGEAALELVLIEEIPHEAMTPSGVSTPLQKIADEVSDNRSPNLGLLMMECFSTDGPVFATAENLKRAIGWCLENQGYMKSAQGV